MDPLQYEQGFFRRKSPASGIFGSVLVVFVLLILLIVLFVLKSTLGLLNGSQLTKSVTTMLDDRSFREQLAETIVAIAPEDTLTVKDVQNVMQEDKIAEAIGQLGSEWFNEILDTDTGDALDPVDAVIVVLEDDDQKQLYKEALEIAMRELDCSDADLHDAAVSLSEEIGFEPPSESGDNLEIIIAVLDGSREKVRTEAAEAFEVVEDIRSNMGGLLSVLSALKAFSRTITFVIVNILLTLVLYGLMVLLQRSLWKPCYYLCVPYFIVGVALICVNFVDFGSLLVSYELPSFAETAIRVLKDSALSTGLIGVGFGLVLIVIAVTVKIEINTYPNHKEDTKLCSVPNAEA